MGFVSAGVFLALFAVIAWIIWGEHQEDLRDPWSGHNSER
jgi:hypothetical protein